MFTKRIVQILIISTLLIALLPVLQASAETSVISIVQNEQIIGHYTYQPTVTYGDGSVVLDPITAGGSGTIVLTNTAGIQLNDVTIVFNAGQTTSLTQSSGATAVITSTAGPSYTVSIKTFPANGVIDLSYQLASTVTSPVTLTAKYTVNSVVNSLSGSTTIQLTATNHAGVAITPTIHIVPADALSPGTHGTPDWTLASSSPGVSAGTPANTLDWKPSIPAGTTTPEVDILATVNDPNALTDGTDVTLANIATSTISYSVLRQHCRSQCIIGDGSD